MFVNMAGLWKFDRYKQLVIHQSVCHIKSTTESVQECEKR